MALEMRESCEKCRCALSPGDVAYICSYECTFCPDCSLDMGHKCPNCGGELGPRPRRAAARIG